MLPRSEAEPMICDTKADGECGVRVGFVRSPYRNLLRPTRLPTRKRRSNVSNTACGILPGEEMMRAGSTEGVISRDYIPSGNTHTGISAKLNICSLYAWQTSLPISERQMRTHATDVAGFHERTGRQTREKEKAPLLVVHQYDTFGCIPRMRYIANSEMIY